MDVLPPLTTFRDSKPTLLVAWWCTCYSIVIIGIRFGGRYVRAEKVFLEDAIMLLAITPLLIRMAFVHFVLLDGTNNTVTAGLSLQAIHQRELGSQLVLGARVFYAAYLWAIKYSTTLFFRTLTERPQKHLLKYLHIFLLLTFLATIVADLGACHPFSHYWQVVPTPSPACRTGAAHLYTMGTLNIVTNLALILFPIPMVMKSKISRGHFTTYTLPHITHHHFAQQTRSLLASLDILFNTFISNAVVLFSLLADRGYKKEKFRQPRLEERKRGRMVPEWGSDEDLVSGKGEVRIGLSDLGTGKDEEEGEGGFGGVGRLVAGGRLGERGGGGGSLKRLPEAKLGSIRVASTWEIRVDDK
ncbi:uncharacterized protein LY89DRAFT_670855 [Mollisia scopiformis]|uniref:Rhodopsin domain-containing protein n=1 Tax=Mollisia scopiformis TaxID=149040 RepID=A0A194X5B2_MOLSC|nr:uncharacterized protein LY89DRAFT_670855 [Mollisia scopiformis]KUJ15378.1 hypothetical protein LY89DRAFT_670855 [Mollisia scopiformis]